MKALFFSILICSSFLFYGLLSDNKDYAKSNNTKTKEYETLNEESEKQEEVSYQKLDLVTNQDIYAEETIMDTNLDIPVVTAEVEETESKENPYEKIEQTKKSFTKLSDDINNNDNIETIKEVGQDLYSLDTSYITEIAELNNQINLAKSNYEEIIKVDEFFSESQELLEKDRTTETINQARNDYQQKDIDNTINKITNPTLKEKYTNKLGEIKNILTDTNPPLTNISEGQIFNDSLNLEISDESSYETYLNDELIQDKTISEPGNYELKVIDEALNETIVNFTIQKTEVTPTITEETPLATPVAFPMHNWYLTQEYSGKYGHMGLDMGSYNKQEEIYPIADGTVIYVGQDNNGANLVKILHHINGQDVYATYAHMREVYFTPWQIVTPNDLLGLMGSTGNSTGPHLHLELTTCDYTYNCNYEEYKNSLLNPWDYLPKI